ncbi:1,4-alpha-glucan-branching enzyme [Parasponia andersonii]|uniref:1,4-alpha-glucan-branching enzyme n=1 Tax=Parasponia andersonii TaxID=3476 RepID=A0A2P5AJ29_PARAD|nr:1,4-alpha-glucan-branching enzyme [Parasponia andersonii]
MVAASKVLEYAQLFSVIFTVAEYKTPDSLLFRIIAPSFSTHSFGMNQRMVVMKLTTVSRVTVYGYNTTVLGLSTAEIAPPKYFMLFVVHSGIPSPDTWVKLQ